MKVQVELTTKELSLVLLALQDRCGRCKVRFENLTGEVQSYWKTEHLVAHELLTKLLDVKI